MSGPLSGKVAIVTGASRGIGAAIVQRLADGGAQVVVNYVSNAAAANEIVGGINEKQGNSNAAIAVQADVSTISGAKELVEKTVAVFKKIDILIMNAGTMGYSTLEQLNEEFFDKSINFNIKGPIFLVKTATPYIPEGGRIMFVSSSLTRAMVVPANYLMYVATKGAVEQMTRTLCKEFGPKKITVNCIAPGPIDTELFRDGKTPQMIDFFTNLHPQKRLGQPDDIAGMAAFLAGPEGRWVNGQTLFVNGGYQV